MFYGYIYYNGNSYEDWIYKTEGNNYEFKIPFNELGIHDGSILEHIRIFIQDMSNNWKLVGDIKSNEYVVKDNFLVYSG